MENPNFTSVSLPLALLRVALKCAAQGNDDRPDLCGVYLHVHQDEVQPMVRMVGSDLARLLVASTPLHGEVPDWLAEGIILDREALATALGFLASVKVETVKLACLSGGARAILSDPGENASFRVRPVNATYGEYARYLETLNLEARELPDMASTAFAPGQLRSVAEVAKLLGKEVDQVRLHGSANDEEPSLVTFPDRPEIIMVLLPGVQKQRQLAAPTLKLLEGPVGGTVSALRAHQSRFQQALDKITGNRVKVNGKFWTRNEANAKIGDYKERIDALLGTVALPAPEPEPVVEVVIEDGSTEVEEIGYPSPGELLRRGIEHETGDATLAEQVKTAIDGSATEAGPEIEAAAYRAKLHGRARQKAVTKFTADINAILSRDHDQTVGDRGAAVDGMYASGMTVEQVAEALAADRPGDSLEAAE